MDTMHTILRSAKGFFCGTFLSRVSGFCRDMAMAFCFGSSAEAAAFLVAFRLANLFRRVLGEGNLQSGFIPHFEGLRKESFVNAVHFYRETALFLGFMSAVIILAFEGILWGILGYLSPSWREIAVLTMWMLPGLFFICLSGIHQAFLQSQKKYFIPSLTPALFNVVWMIGAFFTKTMTELAFWITAGSILQWAISARLVRLEMAGIERKKREWFSSSCKKLIQTMTLGLLGVAAVQVNSALDAIFSRLADLSGPVYLWYAIRIQQMPLALFGLALSGALLPPLARAFQDGDENRFYDFLKSALRRVAVLIIPSSLGMISLGGMGLNFLLGHGQFSSQDVQETAGCLCAYAVGLIPAVFVLLLSQASYAKKNYWLPAKASLFSVLVNVFLNALFVFGFHWGSASIALATSISSFVNAYTLFKTLPGGVDKELTDLSAKLLGASVLAAAFVWTLQTLSYPELGITMWEKIWQLSLSSLAFLGVFLGICALLKVEEIWKIVGLRRNAS